MPDYRAQLYRGKYYAVWSENGETKRASLRTSNHEEAKRRLIDFIAALAAPQGALVRDIVQAYFDYKEPRVHDFVRMKYAWQAAGPTFGHLRPDQVTRELCETYARQRRDAGRGDATILKELNIVRQAFNFAKVSVGFFEAPAAPDPRQRALTKDEANQLIDGCSQPHVKLYVLLALSTAGRKRALLDLRWSQVDWTRGNIALAGEATGGRKGRATVPMTDRLRTELEAAFKAKQTPYVIEYHGKKVGDVKKGFGLAVVRAGLVDVHPHDLRHTAAVWMAEAGLSMAEIAQYLGHSDEKMAFRVYARYSPNHLRNAAKALEF